MPKGLNKTYSINIDTFQARRDIQKLFNDIGTMATSSSFKNSLNLGLTDQILEANKAVASLRNSLSQSINPSTGNLNLTNFSDQLSKTGITLGQYQKQLSSLGSIGTQTFKDLTKSIITAEAPLTRTSRVASELSTVFKNTIGWQATSTAIHGLINNTAQAINYVKSLDSSLNNIRIVTGQSQQQMEDFAINANKAAKMLNTTTNEYAKASLIYYQQGLSDKQVQERTETTLKLANVSGQHAKTVSDQMTAIWNNFYNGSKSLEYYADVITALGATTASSSEEIAKGLSKFSSIAQTTGLSYEYATSALSTVVAATRQSADSVGTSFKTLFARLQGLNLGKTLDDGTTLNKYSKALLTAGVNIKTTSGDLKDMDTILSELSEKWKALGDSEKVALAQTVGGARNYSTFMSLMENWDDFQTNLETAKNAQGTLQKQANIYAESWEAASAHVRAASETIYKNLVDDKAFKGMINGFGSVLDIVGAATTSMGGFKGALMSTAALSTRLFGTQISEGIENAGYNLSRIFGGTQAVENLRKQAIDSLVNQPGMTSLEKTFTDNFATRNQAYLDAVKNGSLSKVQQPIAQQMLANIADAENQVIAQSQIVDNMRSSSSSLIRTAMTTDYQEMTSYIEKASALRTEINDLNEKNQNIKEQLANQNQSTQKQIVDSRNMPLISSNQLSQKQINELETQYAKNADIITRNNRDVVAIDRILQEKGFNGAEDVTTYRQTYQTETNKLRIALRQGDWGDRVLQAISPFTDKSAGITNGPIGSTKILEAVARLRNIDLVAQKQNTTVGAMLGLQQNSANSLDAIFKDLSNITAKYNGNLNSEEAIQAFEKFLTKNESDIVSLASTSNDKTLDALSSFLKFTGTGGKGVVNSLVDLIRAENTNLLDEEKVKDLNKVFTDLLKNNTPQISFSSALTTSIQGLAGLGSAITSIGGAIKVFQDETATTTDKIGAMTGALYSGGMALSGITNIANMAGTEIKGLGISGGQLSFITALAAAGIIAGNQAYEAYQEVDYNNQLAKINELANASQQTASISQDIANSYSASLMAYEQSLSDLSNYQIGSTEYYNSLNNANNTALGLITDYGIDSDKYTIDSRGVINLDKKTLLDLNDKINEQTKTDTQNAILSNTLSRFLDNANYLYNIQDRVISSGETYGGLSTTNSKLFNMAVNSPDSVFSIVGTAIKGIGAIAGAIGDIDIKHPIDSFKNIVKDFNKAQSESPVVSNLLGIDQSYTVKGLADEWATAYNASGQTLSFSKWWAQNHYGELTLPDNRNWDELSVGEKAGSVISGLVTPVSKELKTLLGVNSDKELGEKLLEISSQEAIEKVIKLNQKEYAALINTYAGFQEDDSGLTKIAALIASQGFNESKSEELVKSSYQILNNLPDQKRETLINKYKEINPDITPIALEQMSDNAIKAAILTYSQNDTLQGIINTTLEDMTQQYGITKLEEFARQYGNYDNLTRTELQKLIQEGNYSSIGNNLITAYTNADHDLLEVVRNYIDKDDLKNQFQLESSQVESYRVIDSIKEDLSIANENLLSAYITNFGDALGSQTAAYIADELVNNSKLDLNFQNALDKIDTKNGISALYSAEQGAKYYETSNIQLSQQLNNIVKKGFEDIGGEVGFFKTLWNNGDFNSLFQTLSDSYSSMNLMTADTISSVANKIEILGQAINTDVSKINAGAIASIMQEVAQGTISANTISENLIEALSIASDGESSRIEALENIAELNDYSTSSITVLEKTFGNQGKAFTNSFYNNQFWDLPLQEVLKQLPTGIESTYRQLLLDSQAKGESSRDFQNRIRSEMPDFYKYITTIGSKKGDFTNVLDFWNSEGIFGPLTTTDKITGETITTSNLFTYNPYDHYIGLNEEAFFSQKLDKYGNPVLDENGNPVFEQTEAQAALEQTLIDTFKQLDLADVMVEKEKDGTEHLVRPDTEQEFKNLALAYAMNSEDFKGKTREQIIQEFIDPLALYIREQGGQGVWWDDAAAEEGVKVLNSSQFTTEEEAKAFFNQHRFDFVNEDGSLKYGNMNYDDAWKKFQEEWFNGVELSKITAKTFEGMSSVSAEDFQKAAGFSAEDYLKQQDNGVYTEEGGYDYNQAIQTLVNSGWLNENQAKTLMASLADNERTKMTAQIRDIKTGDLKTISLADFGGDFEAFSKAIEDSQTTPNELIASNVLTTNMSDQEYIHQAREAYNNKNFEAAAKFMSQVSDNGRQIYGALIDEYGLSTDADEMNANYSYKGSQQQLDDFEKILKAEELSEKGYDDLAQELIDSLSEEGQAAYKEAKEKKEGKQSEGTQETSSKDNTQQDTEQAVEETEETEAKMKEEAEARAEAAEREAADQEVNTEAAKTLEYRAEDKNADYYQQLQENDSLMEAYVNSDAQSPTEFYESDQYKEEREKAEEAAKEAERQKQAEVDTQDAEDYAREVQEAQERKAEEQRQQQIEAEQKAAEDARVQEEENSRALNEISNSNLGAEYAAWQEQPGNENKTPSEFMAEYQTSQEETEKQTTDQQSQPDWDSFSQDQKDEAMRRAVYNGTSVESELLAMGEEQKQQDIKNQANNIADNFDAAIQNANESASDMVDVTGFGEMPLSDAEKIAKDLHQIAENTGTSAELQEALNEAVDEGHAAALTGENGNQQVDKNGNPVDENGNPIDLGDQNTSETVTETATDRGGGGGGGNDGSSGSPGSSSSPGNSDSGLDSKTISNALWNQRDNIDFNAPGFDAGGHHYDFIKNDQGVTVGYKDTSTGNEYTMDGDPVITQAVGHNNNLLPQFAAGTDGTIAVTGELGPELHVKPNGDMDLLGKHGREYAWVEPDDKIYTAAQTASILKDEKFKETLGFASGINNFIPGYYVGLIQNKNGSSVGTLGSSDGGGGGYSGGGRSYGGGGEPESAIDMSPQNHRYDPNWLRYRDVLERYYTILQQMDDIAQALSRFAELADRAWGKERIQNLEEVIKLQQDQVSAQRQYLSEIKDYLKEDAQAVTNSISEFVTEWNAAYPDHPLGFDGVEMDENGVITNYREIVEHMIDAYNMSASDSSWAEGLMGIGGITVAEQYAVAQAGGEQRIPFTSGIYTSDAALAQKAQQAQQQQGGMMGAIDPTTGAMMDSTTASLTMDGSLSAEGQGAAAMLTSADLSPLGINYVNQDGQTKLEEQLKDIQQYTETLNLYQQQRIVLDQMQEQLFDTRLKAIQVELDYKLTLNNNDLILLNYQLNKVKNDAYAAAEAVSLIGQQQQINIDILDKYEKELKDIINLNLNGEAWAEGAIFDFQKLTDEKFEEFKNNPQTFFDWIADMEQNADFSNFTASEIQTLTSIANAFLSQIAELKNDFLTQIDYLGNAVKTYAKDMDTVFNKFDHYKNLYNDWQNIIDLTGRSATKLSHDLIVELNSRVVDNAINKLSAAKKQFNELSRVQQQVQDTDGKNYQKALENLQKVQEENRKTLEEFQGTDAERTALEKSLSDKEYWLQNIADEYKVNIDKINKETEEAEDAYMKSWEDALQGLATAFAQSMKDAADGFEESFSPIYKTFDALTSALDRQRALRELYLQSYQQAHDLSQLNRDMKASILDTDNLRSKRELKKLLDDINQVQEDGIQLSSYDLDIMQKKYDLELARAALEDAKNAKALVRLARDNNGNWSYVYSANEDDVDEAEQNYEDAILAMEQANENYIDELQNQLIQVWADAEAQLTALSPSEFKNRADYDDRVKEIVDAANQQVLFIQGQMKNALDNNNYLLNNVSGKAAEIMLDLTTNFDNTTLAALTNAKTIDNLINTSLNNIAELADKASLAYKTFQTRNEDVWLTAGYNIADASEALTIAMQDIGAQSIKNVNDMAEAVNKAAVAFDKLNEELNKNADYLYDIISRYETLAESTLKLIEFSGEYVKPLKFEPTDDTMRSLAYTDPDAFHDADEIFSGTSSSSSALDSILEKLLSNEAFLANANIPSHLLTMLESSGLDGAKKFEILKDFMNSNGDSITASLDSFTGRQSPSSQTEYLEYISGNKFIGKDRILSELDRSANIMANGFGNLTPASISTKTGTWQQDVHITAEFPNATNRYEIQEAFNGLQDLASQYARRNY